MTADPYAVTHEHATPEELNASLLEQIARLQKEMQLLRAAARDVVDANRESLSASAVGNINDATMARLTLDLRIRALEKALAPHSSPPRGG